ncbi:MAG: PilZ domain-containing protein [Desulfopila sp.]
MTARPNSKRLALRFPVQAHPLRYKTEFEDGRGAIENVSTGGCAVAELTLPLNLHEKVLVIFDMEEDEDAMEIAAKVVRVETRYVALQFIALDEIKGKRMVKFFAQRRRQGTQ